jgi:homoserine kinase
MIKVRVPATSANLGPGFDTLGIALKLYNDVIIKKSSFFSISIKGEGANNPKLKVDNKFVNIFYDIYKELTGKKDNFRFEFYNNVPLSRGLGSSSAVICSAISSAYELAGVSASKEFLLNKALFYENHPDNISPALLGGFTTSFVHNNRVYFVKKEISPYLKAVVVIPNKSMSTAHSRTKLPKKLTLEDTVYNLSRCSTLTAALMEEKWEILRLASMDKIHQDRRMQALPELFEVQKIALENGALLSTLSGSGSTFFNLVLQGDEKRLQSRLIKQFPYFRVLILDIDNHGVVVY